MTPEVVVAKVFGVEEAAISDSSSNQTLSAWDSLAHMNLILELESVFGVSLTQEDIIAATDVGTIKRVLAQHGVQW